MKKTTDNQSNAPGALNGILVLDHTSALAGPYCTQLLGDLGADVIKIERPDGGDQSRGWGPPFIGKDSAYFLGTNRNKRGITLNLRFPEGREIMDALLKKADVLVHNVPRKSSREKIGLDEAHCKTLNDHLIWASISGFGNSGPYAEQPGYDVIAQGMSGTMFLTGEADDPPTRFPTPIADITAGIYTALAIVTALFARERNGKGQSIDTALLDSQVVWLANIASNYLATGDTPKKIGNAHPSIVPYQPFPASDGWIIVGVGSERLWERFLKVLDWPELSADERFRTNADRLNNREILVPVLAERFRRNSCAEWIEQLKTAGIPCGPIYSPSQALADEHVLARGMIVNLEHPVLGIIRSIGSPMNLSDTPVNYRQPPPLLGEHTSEILSELGYSHEAQKTLQEKGVI